MGVHFLDAAGPEDIRVYAIGDVHGRLDLLRRLHDTIRQEIERDRPADWRIVHLGDYVDRGPDSAGVLDFLINAIASDERHIALAGNHDLGVLEFLAKPDPTGLFANFGGRETAASYGVVIAGRDLSGFVEAHGDLCRAVPREHATFLATRPPSVTLGDFFFCHAGIRPGVPLERQDLQDLVWIRKEFLDWPHLHPKIVVHGHTPHHEPQVMPNRVNLDTLAYQSGILTALVIDAGEKRLISTSGES